SRSIVYQLVIFEAHSLTCLLSCCTDLGSKQYDCFGAHDIDLLKKLQLYSPVSQFLLSIPVQRPTVILLPKYPFGLDIESAKESTKSLI
ncbi:17878_t:CDS:2, partial [Racocetra persica]